jgi:translation elongation factor EF-Tu-like GTPase
LRATFTLLGTDEGGRKSAVFGDYRPNWSVGVADPSQQSGARVVIDGAERIEPGGSADVRLFPLWPEFWAA